MKTLPDDFKTLKVTASDIDWDFNDWDFTWSVDEKNKRPTKVSFDYDKQDMIERGFLKDGGIRGSLEFDEDAFLDEISDRLTDEYEYKGVKLCHNGFALSYKLLYK